MKSFKQIISEARPKGQKRYSRDVTKLENLLDKLYSSGVSQKKINRAEMRLARKTNEGEYDVEDTLQKLEPHLAHDDHSPPAESLEELMINAARKIYSHGHTPEEVGQNIRASMGDFLHHPVDVQPNVSNKDLGDEAHRMLISRMNLIKKVKAKKK